MTAEQGTPALYRKVADDVRSAIAAGTYPPNTRLPSESELADSYGVSRGTVRQAFAALRADGVIASRRGARRVVIGGPRVQSFGELLSFSRWARAMGEEPSGRVIGLERRPAEPEEARRLALPDDAQVYHLVRLRLLSGRPVMIERASYPDAVGVLVAGLDLEGDSITERLEDLGIVFADAEHVIDAVPASAEDARSLCVRPGLPLLRARRLTTDPSARPVEWSDDRYLGTEAAFSVHNSLAVNALSRTPASSLRHVQDPKAIGFRRIPINDLDCRPGPLPDADAWRAGELDLPAGAFDRDARPGFGSARPVRAARAQHIGEDGDRVVALEGDEGGRFG
jgi:GntR family transcriptional regulator